MGLCKCPKRKVTTQFCYEHRVNVCEHCVVINHPKCVVQSYLLWLQDSDYSPQCTLCKRNLSDDECARLSCYHVYHWDCLDQHVRDLPETTAPAGYKCPSCSESILPKQNSASPVADALREKLSTVNWGRIGLGLPLFYRVVTTFRSDLRIFMLTIVANILLAVIWSTVCSRLPSPIYTPRQKYRNTYETLVKQSTEDIIKPPKKSSPKSPALMNSLNDKQNIVNPEGIVVHVEENLHIRPESSAQVPRRNPHGVIGEKIVLLDEDENKYRRRYGFLRLSLWFKFLQNQMNFSKKGPRGACKLIFFIVILFSLTCVIFSVLGNVMTQDDPAFDVHNDPNVRVNNE